MKLQKKIIIAILIILLGINNLSFSFLVKNNHNDILDETNIIETNNDKLEIIEETDDKVYFKDIKVGDIVEYGRFYDIVNDEIVKVPIKWQVLDVLNGFALLITDYIIKTMPYNYSWSPTNWKESNIRLWLNNDFYDIAFNDDEKKNIQYVTTENTGNYAYNINTQYQTKDNVFLLSIEEARKYYKTSEAYMSLGTQYAVREGLWISRYSSSVGFSVWWLRSPGRTLSSAAIVHAAGGIGFGGDGVATRGNGVRPCIWVKIN